MYLTWCEAAHARGLGAQRRPTDPAAHGASLRGQVTWLIRRLDQLGPDLPAREQKRCAASFGRSGAGDRPPRRTLRRCMRRRGLARVGAGDNHTQDLVGHGLGDRARSRRRDRSFPTHGQVGGRETSLEPVEITTTATPCAFSRPIVSRTLAIAGAPRLAVGSSMITSLASNAVARAIATACWPPESARTGVSTDGTRRPRAAEQLACLARPSPAG